MSDDQFETVMHADGRSGPVTKQEILKLFADGAISLQTPIFAPGMPKRAPLWAIRELVSIQKSIQEKNIYI